MSNNTEKPTIVSFLRKLMERQKRLPSQLAKDIGVSHPTFSRWLTGDDIPNSVSCRKIATYSGVPVEEVLVIAGHLNKGKPDPVTEWPEFREYVSLKYPDELDEDIIIMVEDLIERRREKRLTTR